MCSGSRMCWRGHGDILRRQTRSHKQRNKLLRRGIRHDWRPHERHLHLLDRPLPPEASNDKPTTPPQPIFDRRDVTYLLDPLCRYPASVQRSASSPMDDDHDGKISSIIPVLHKLMSESEWSLCMSAQPLSICNHRWSRPGSQYSGGTLQDRHHCDSRLDLDR